MSIKAENTRRPLKEVRLMGPRHECLPFGGPHRHGIHYSASTSGKAPDRAKIPQIKKISSSTKSSDISTLIDTRNGAGKQGEANGRSESGQDEMSG